MASLGSEILQMTTTSTRGINSSVAESVPLALGTLRKWATCLTVSAVVNVTAPEGACLRITGLSEAILNERCGPEGEGRAAATAVELLNVGGETTTRALPCLVGDGGVAASAGSVVLKLRGGGTVTALSFALSHL
eukprot:COSAG03_NODE_478_length_7595_cov_4.439568_5_plen_135_part_00